MSPNRFPWPASKIDRDVMHELWVMSKKRGKPITIIVAEAVHGHLNQQFHEHRSVAAPAVPYHVSATPAA